MLRNYIITQSIEVWWGRRLIVDQMKILLWTMLTSSAPNTCKRVKSFRVTCIFWSSHSYLILEEKVSHLYFSWFSFTSIFTSVLKCSEKYKWRCTKQQHCWETYYVPVFDYFSSEVGDFFCKVKLCFYDALVRSSMQGTSWVCVCAVCGSLWCFRGSVPYGWADICWEGDNCGYCCRDKEKAWGYAS